MTDITELAQSLKATAIDAKELAIISRYSKGRAAAEKFYALANPNNVLALVEALEKAQQRIAELESRAVKLPELCVGVVQDGHAVMVPYPAGHWFNKTAILEMLADAGIKVEA
ncbi:ead/Ea22-like family protein [Klebsiella pneumoniae]|uniref:ead/Ea22-like family protein n=1 Tax=Klebsiella pneumoniae TaxID=573 RepID=UPI002152037C|nr:ead/Ea22-like family protein [Klebsiella pneumoniae]